MHRIHAPRGVLGCGQFGHRCLYEVTSIRGKCTPTKSTKKQTATGGTTTFQSDRLAWTDAFKTANEWSPFDRSTNPHRRIHKAANQNLPPVHHSASHDFLQQHSTNQNVVYPQSGYGSVAATETFLEETLPVAETKHANFDVSFDDFKTAFSKKSNWELIRALSVLRVCSFEVVADHSLKLMSTSQRVLGKTASDWLMKKTVYGQFVAGETTAEIKEAVSRLQEVNVGPLLAAPMEDDIHTHHPDADTTFDANLNTILNGMRLARELDPLYPMTQLKMTALMPGDLCALLSERCPHPSQSPHVVEAMAAALCGQHLNIDEVFGKEVPDMMKHHLEQGIRRVREVCKLAISQEVIVMVDAEYTYLNPALNLITLAMMLVCNEPARRSLLIFYTYQNYLQSTRDVMERDMKFLETSGVGFAAKMVRGAYMYKERLLACKQGHPDPVHATFDATSAAYDAAVTSVLNKMAANPRQCRMIVASHNEKSALSAVKRIQELDIDPSGGGVFFGQLMGMADHISCSLGMNGFLARKSLPYGPVAETLPYLSRRAQENKAIIAGARRERELLKSELRSRVSIGS